jgi:methylase of polypeptide subunit release factors
MINIVELSHEILKKHQNPIISVDMTCGNGFDTLFLASFSNKVYAFDIQDKAINNTKELLKEHNISNVTVIKESHEFFDIFVREKIDLVIYNLGYLPNGDKSIKTDALSVVKSLKKAIDSLNCFGIIAVVIYLHDLEENNQVQELVKSLDSRFDVMEHRVLNKKNSPYIIEIKRIRD